MGQYAMRRLSNLFIACALVIIIVFVCGILYDKIRLLFMPRIGFWICQKLTKLTSKYSIDN